MIGYATKYQGADVVQQVCHDVAVVKDGDSSSDVLSGPIKIETLFCKSMGNKLTERLDRQRKQRTKWRREVESAERDWKDCAAEDREQMRTELADLLDYHDQHAWQILDVANGANRQVSNGKGNAQSDEQSVHERPESLGQ